MNARTCSALLVSCALAFSTGAFAQAAGGSDQTSPLKAPEVQKQKRDKPQNATKEQRAATNQEYQSRSAASEQAKPVDKSKKAPPATKTAKAPMDKQAKREAASKQEKELQKASSGQ